MRMDVNHPQRAGHQRHRGAESHGAENHLLGKRVHGSWLRVVTNDAPQLASSGAGTCRISKDFLSPMSACQRLQRMAQFVAGKLVGFGGHEQKTAPYAAQEVRELE